MAFSSFNEFINMGGHGLYVWMAYGAGLLVLLYNIVAPRTQRTAVFRRLAQQFKREKLSK